MEAEVFEKNSRDFNKTLIFADCHYIECCYSLFSVITLSVITLSVITLSVIIVYLASLH